MERTERCYAAWLTLVGDLLRADPDDRSLPHDTVVELLRESFDASSCMRNAVDTTWTDHLIGCWPHGFLSAQAVERPVDATFHPLIRWYAVTGADRPQTTASVPRGVAARKMTAEWSAFARPLGVTHQLCLPLQVGAGMHAYVVGRSDRDFTEADRALATALAPALGAVLRQRGILAGVTGAQRSSAQQLGLTGREVAVLHLLGQGLTAASIARRLGTSPRTVHKHLEHVYRKLGVQDRLLAVLRARHLGLLG
ncbi:response regulator transcription factor [Blastococcus sp. SYSU DS0619]